MRGATAAADIECSNFTAEFNEWRTDLFANITKIFGSGAATAPNLYTSVYQTPLAKRPLNVEAEASGLEQVTAVLEIAQAVNEISQLYVDAALIAENWEEG